jgi:phage shock protein A
MVNEIKCLRERLRATEEFTDSLNNNDDTYQSLQKIRATLEKNLLKSSEQIESFETLIHQLKASEDERI